MPLSAACLMTGFSFAIGRVDDDDVRASRDKIADVGDLFRRAAIAIGTITFETWPDASASV
jgi:hypothetical protein